MASSVFVQTIHHDKYPFIDPAINTSLNQHTKGKTILITGASSGIGKRIADYFALTGAATVILTARRPKQLEEAKMTIQGMAPECDVVTFVMDIADEQSIEKLFAELKATENMKVPDVLVNNAGSSVGLTSIMDSKPEIWWRDSECNIRGTYLCSRAYLRALNGEPGTIINISSGASSGVAPGFSGYSAGKAAVNRLTEYIDAEHSSQGVRCFALHPGAVGGTDMSLAAPEWLKPYLIDKADLAAGTCLYLLDPRADFLMGRYLSSNWDLEEVEGKRAAVLENNLLKTRVALS